MQYVQAADTSDKAVSSWPEEIPLQKWWQEGQAKESVSGTAVLPVCQQVVDRLCLSFLQCRTHEFCGTSNPDAAMRVLMV